MAHSRKDMREVIEYAERHGFRVVSTKRHFVLKRGSRSITLSSSPSCPHAAHHARKDVDRVLKEAQYAELQP